MKIAVARKKAQLLLILANGIEPHYSVQPFAYVVQK